MALDGVMTSNITPAAVISKLQGLRGNGTSEPFSDVLIDLVDLVALLLADGPLADELDGIRAIAGIGLVPLDPVVFATTANPATGVAAGTTHDGHVAVAGEAFVAWSGPAGAAGVSQGVYIVPSSGAAARRPDADTGAELKGALISVLQGTTYGGSVLVVRTTEAITVGATPIRIGILLDRQAFAAALQTLQAEIGTARGTAASLKARLDEIIAVNNAPLATLNAAVFPTPTPVVRGFSDVTTDDPALTTTPKRVTRAQRSNGVAVDMQLPNDGTLSILDGYDFKLFFDIQIDAAEKRAVRARRKSTGAWVEFTQDIGSRASAVTIVTTPTVPVVPASTLSVPVDVYCFTFPIDVIPGTIASWWLTNFIEYNDICYLGLVRKFKAERSTERGVNWGDLIVCELRDGALTGNAYVIAQQFRNQDDHNAPAVSICPPGGKLGLVVFQTDHNSGAPANYTWASKTISAKSLGAQTDLIKFEDTTYNQLFNRPDKPGERWTIFRRSGAWGIAIFDDVTEKVIKVENVVFNDKTPQSYPNVWPLRNGLGLALSWQMNPNVDMGAESGATYGNHRWMPMILLYWDGRVTDLDGAVLAENVFDPAQIAVDPFLQGSRVYTPPAGKRFRHCDLHEVRPRVWQTVITEWSAPVGVKPDETESRIKLITIDASTGPFVQTVKDVCGGGTNAHEGNNNGYVAGTALVAENVVAAARWDSLDANVNARGKLDIFDLRGAGSANNWPSLKSIRSPRKLIRPQISTAILGTTAAITFEMGKWLKYHEGAIGAADGGYTGFADWDMDTKRIYTKGLL